MFTKRHLSVALAAALALAATAPAHAKHRHHHHGQGHHGLGHHGFGRTATYGRHGRWHDPSYRVRDAEAVAHARAAARLDRTGGVRVAMRYLGSRNPTGTRGPWCVDFLNLTERRAGRKGVAARYVTAYLGYGHASGPVPGAIVVFRSHVGRVIQRIGNMVEVVSGNYGHRVGIGMYPVRTAIAYRMP